MLSTLVDNSTLSAVARITGDIPVALSFPVEGDLAAFDQYLQSLILYDEVAAIDDYKDEFKTERRGSFKEVRFLEPTLLGYKEAEAYASEALASVAFSIELGRISSGPLSDLLDTLDLHVAPAWYMHSSNWFLNVRLLADEADISLPKYGSLMSAIYAQGAQANRSTFDLSEQLAIQDGDGDKVDVNARGHRTVDSDIKAFASSLNWIASRSVFYFYMSALLECATTLHPIRHAYLGKYVADHVGKEMPSDIRKALGTFFKNEVSSIKASSDKMAGQIAATVALPFFAAWAVGYAGTPRSGYDHVLQIRNGIEARTLRARFREIEEATRANDETIARKSLAKLYGALADDLRRLSSKFQGAKPNPGFGVSINALSLTPSISIPDVPDRLRGLTARGEKKALTVLRNISSDFLIIPSLGKLSDRFTRSRKIAKGTEFVKDKTRIENKRFKLSSTWFKQPL